MSLVNSMINQVGREIGRDLYWSARQSLSSSNGGRKRSPRSSSPISGNEAILQLVQQKKWASTMRLVPLAEDIAETIAYLDEHLDPRSFDWREAYMALDQKIDDLKLTCEESAAATLEDLDKKNYISYSIALERHKTWIQKEIDSLNQRSPASSSFKIFLLSFVGLASPSLRRGPGNAISEVLLIVICYAALIIGIKLLSHSTLGLYGVLSILLSFAILLFALIGNFISLRRLKNEDHQSFLRKQALEKYLASW